MWPFGKNKDAGRPARKTDHSPADTEADDATADAARAVTSPDEDATVDGPSFDPVNGDFGPFDGDSVDYREFDFSDFAKGGLDLGSMMIPVPHSGEVQVEMGQQGPRQIHLLTPHGRITPAAFAAPRSGGQWSGDIDEFAEGMTRDGLEVTRRENDWGIELVGTIGDGVVRVIGVDGPRWMLRMTLAGPAGSADALAELAYEVISRTFVNRGDDPVPAGRALPVVIPQAMAKELERAIAQQQAQAAQNGQGEPGSQTSPVAKQVPVSPTTPVAPQRTPDGGTRGDRAEPVRRRTGGTVGRRMGGTE